jgi:iron complex outermembrane recepter protein
MGDPNLLSEEMIAYEAGIRGQPTERFYWDLALFFNDYQRLVVPVPGAPYFDPDLGIIIAPTPDQNAMAGHTYGFELAITYKVTERWRLHSAYSFLVMDLRPVPGLTVDQDAEDSSPRNQVYLQSSWDLGRRWELDLMGRYVDSLPAFAVPSYFVADVRLAWHASKRLELSVVGRNLFNGHFYEFGNDILTGVAATEVQPQIYGQLAYRL